MSNNPLVSIIVPVYKVESYLDRCVQSVIQQTYKHWELILVDDGSPDKSGDICDSWTKRDNRILVFHKENGGVSSARNVGLDNMSGDYVTFLDSDDWLYDTCLETCLSVAQKNDLDVLQFGWTDVNPDDTITVQKREETSVCSDRQFAELGKLSVSVCGGFYKASIIRENNIRFDESMAYAEDQLFVFMCLNSSERVKAIAQPLYYYYQNADSVTQNSNTEKLVKSCIVFSRHKEEVGYYAPYIDIHNMYVITDLVANRRLPNEEIKQLYRTLNIDKSNIKNKNHILFVFLSGLNFNFACHIIKFYRKYFLNELIK